MTRNERKNNFLFPKFTGRYLLRLLIIAIGAYLFFSEICIPVHINGISMEPTYRDGAFTFCCRLPYLLHKPRVGDIVFIRMSGKKVMYMKRVIALSGDRVAFQNGYLYVNGRLRQEDYVITSSNWNLPPRTVKPGCVYVAGDNRAISLEDQVFGQVPISRIVGKTIW